jgi:hypothetical protein
VIETEVPPPAELSLLTTAELAARITTTHAELVERETRILQLGCAWADVHDIDSTDPHYQPLIERACIFGGEGTPEVAEHCVAEFASLQSQGLWAGRLLIADALDLRHRLPELWKLVGSGAVRAWAARKVAQETRDLSYEACRDLDRAISHYVPLLPWKRFAPLLHATILEHDPVRAAARAERARTRRDVWAVGSEDGLKLLLARAASGDVTWFLATVNRIADILALQGDTDPVGARRAKAVGILAQPVLALQLLLDHQHDPDPGPIRTGEAAADDAPPDPDDPEPTAAAGPAEAPEGGDHPVEGAGRSLNLSGKAFRREDLVAARPKVVLYFHLTDASLRDGLGGNVRPEHGDLLTLDQLHTFLADTDCSVTVKPVIDPAAVAAVDAYEIPGRVREAARLGQLADVFPYGTSLSRTMDLDHTVPYKSMTDGGPPGQTRVGNLGPHSRSTHRTKTHSSWGERQPDRGTYLHRTPTGYVFVVTNQGTIGLGKTAYADAVWHAAGP